MAKLIIDGQEYEVTDGEPIAEICEEAGVLFSCNTGVCGSCLVRVIDGSENLSKLKIEEEELGLDGSSRLACMCYIKSGTVVLSTS